MNALNKNNDAYRIIFWDITIISTVVFLFLSWIEWRLPGSVGNYFNKQYVLIGPLVPVLFFMLMKINRRPFEYIKNLFLIFIGVKIAIWLMLSFFDIDQHHPFIVFMTITESTALLLMLILIGIMFFEKRRSIKDEIDSSIKLEKIIEKHRKDIFDKKWRIKKPNLNSFKKVLSSFFLFPIHSFRFSAYCTIRWFYVEGWKNIMILILVILVGFALRIINYDVLQIADYYNLISAKALLQNGTTFYTRNLDYSCLVALLFKAFSPSIFWARLLPIIYGTISIFLIYLLTKKICSKKIGLIAAGLLAISPWAIGISLSIREYSFNMMLEIIILLLGIMIYEKSKTLHSAKFIIPFLALCAFVYIYSRIFENFTILVIFITFGLFIVGVLINKLRENELLGKYKLVYFFAIVLFPLALFYANRLNSTYFAKGYEINSYWIRIFFDPRVSFPMQWFSSADGSLIILLLFAFGASLIFFSSKKIKLLAFVVVLYLVFMTFKFNNEHSAVPRYVYHLFPFFTIVFAFSLFTLYQIFKFITVSFDKKAKQIMAGIFIIFLFFLVNPLNTYFAVHSNHQPSVNKSKRSTYTTFNNGYYNLIRNLKDSGLEKNDPIVVENIYNLIIWYFDYDINPDVPMQRPEGNRYDNGLNMYQQSKLVNMFQLNEALNTHSDGWILIRNEENSEFSEIKGYGDKEIIIPNNITISRIDTFDREDNMGYNLFKWQTKY